MTDDPATHPGDIRRALLHDAVRDWIRTEQRSSGPASPAGVHNRTADLVRRIMDLDTLILTAQGQIPIPRTHPDDRDLPEPWFQH